MLVENTISLLRGSYSTPEGPACVYAMTNRHGGQGRGLFSSNNMSFDAGDDKKAVIENRQRLKSQLDLSILLSAQQVHGTGVFCLEEQLHDDMEVQGYDALVTDLTGVGLMIQQADCQAVLLFDPEHLVIAAIHCGWRGSVQNILAKTVTVMQEKYGSRPAGLLGTISPSLGPCCAEFVNHKSELPNEFTSYMIKRDYFDFWKISKAQLNSVGVISENISVTGLCTGCSEDYFSYRKACRESDGITGRNCSIIYL